MRKQEGITYPHTTAVYRQLASHFLRAQIVRYTWPHEQKGKAQGENHLTSGTEGCETRVLI